MITSTSSIIIRRPKTELYNFLMAPEQAGLWQSIVVHLDAPHGLVTDAPFVMTCHILGQTVKIRGKVKDNDGSSRFIVLSSQGPIRFENVWELAETPEGTEVSVTSHIDAGMVFHLAEPALEAIYTSRTDSDLKTLKTLLEAGITSGEQFES